MRTFTSSAADDTGAADKNAGVAHDLKHVLEEHERDLILTALRASHGNKAKAARALGITERLMGICVKHLGIDWRSLRPRYAGTRPGG